ncbi:MAG: phosphoglucosamine mutase [Oscillospiraceae bacterium]|nr:phosphoglucosamine mutase [Oscillospiraceae bacterium]
MISLGKFFGTDGIRGIAGVDLTADFAFKLGNVVGSYLLNKQKSKIITIGRDTRISSGMLEAAISAGICAAGMDINLLEVVPTPLVSFAILREKLAGGIMITASHNPFEYNGIKVFGSNGIKLEDWQEQEIEALFEKSVLQNVSHVDVGVVRRDNLTKIKYVESLKGLISSLQIRPKIAIDCANGSASATANLIFGELGNLGDLKIINQNPDGININKHCGSTDMRSLIEFVKKEGSDIGFAFDGDADRCLTVNSSGEVLDGDNILMILARFMIQNKKLAGSKVVATKLSNMGFLKAMADLGIEVTTTDVGDKYVFEEMGRSGANLGGENSGHLICLDYSKAGDGQLTACLLLKAISELGLDFNELGSEFKKFPQVGKNIRVKDNKAIIEKKALKDEIERCKGALKDGGRVIVRASGTEPVIRIMVEGQDQKQIEELAESLAKTVEELSPS